MTTGNQPVSELTRSAMTAEELERYAYIHMPEVHPFAAAALDTEDEYVLELEAEVQELEEQVDKLRKQQEQKL